MGALTVASILEQVERDLLRRAKEESEAFARTQNERLQEELSQLAAELSAKKAAVQTQGRYDTQAISDKSVATMNEASMKTALARLQIRERLANLGHRGGGLLTDALNGAERAQVLRRTQTREAQDAAVNELNVKAFALYRELEDSFAKKMETLQRETAQKIADKQTSLEAAAKKQAKQIARSAKSIEQWQSGLY